MSLKSSLLILKQVLSSANWTKIAPLQLTGEEKRLGFRVIVADLPEHIQRKISTSITLGEQTSPATMVDLSLSGMLIADLDLGVKVGDTVTVSLEFDGRAAVLEGAVVRDVDRGSVGVHFPESIKDGEFDPPIPLSNLHRKLERLWLKSREKK
jgi:hypothetical protein